MKPETATVRRPLDTYPLSAQFVIGVLGIDNLDEANSACINITDAELALSRYNDEDTYDSISYRDIRFQNNLTRRKLRIEIFEELIQNKRLENDDKITKGVGGSLPLTDVQYNKQAIIVIGLPASGKSTISSKIADEYGAIILDSDYAKRKLPEFNHRNGASMVHKESTAIIFGIESDPKLLNLKGFCVSQGINVVIPKIGNETDNIIELADYFCKYDYSVHLLLISLDRKEATKRAYNRFIDTKRYVPLSLIFDLYSNDPTLTYYRIKNDSHFKSFGKISTKEKNPTFVDGSEYSPALIFK